jgi:Skp family chaperone for outer membrane proteins
MKTLPVILVAAVAVLAGASQEKAPSGRSAVLNLRECMDRSRNVWIADIEQELQKQQEADAGRASDLNPQERLRIRTKNQDMANRKRLEVYAEIVRLSGGLAKERGFDMVQRVDRMPTVEPGDPDVTPHFERRGVLYFDPSVDLTSAVLEQLNRDYAARKK